MAHPLQDPNPGSFLCTVVRVLTSKTCRTMASRPSKSIPAPMTTTSGFWADLQPSSWLELVFRKRSLDVIQARTTQHGKVVGGEALSNVVQHRPKPELSCVDTKRRQEGAALAAPLPGESSNTSERRD